MFPLYCVLLLEKLLIFFSKYMNSISKYLHINVRSSDSQLMGPLITSSGPSIYADESMVDLNGWTQHQVYIILIWHFLKYFDIAFELWTECGMKERSTKNLIMIYASFESPKQRGQWCAHYTLVCNWFFFFFGGVGLEEIFILLFMEYYLFILLWDNSLDDFYLCLRYEW